MDPNDTTNTTNTDPAPEIDTAAEAMAAMDKGVEEATPDDSDLTPEPEAPIPGVEHAEPAKPEAPVPEEVTPDEADKPDSDTEAEITGMGLKEKAATRFRELTAEAKEGTKLREALTAAGVKDLAVDLPKFIQKAQAADDLIGMVSDSGASPEQYGQTLDYLSLINKGVGGDRQSAERAFEIAQREVQNLATLLGKEVPGVHDPLEAHEDLREDMEAGELTRKRALEIAASRQQQSVTTAQQRQQQQVQAGQQAESQGKAALQQFDQQMYASDPSYAAKRPQLNSLVTFIRKTLPAEQWMAATQQAYATIQTPAAPTPAPAPALPRPGPIRGGNTRQVMVPTTDDPMEAMMQGIAAASE